MHQDVDTLIVGAGPAGLACAQKLIDAGRSVLVWEAGTRAGGAVRSEVVSGYHLEWGPNSILSSAERTVAGARAVGVEPVLASSDARHRYIWRSGGLRRLPAGPASLLTTSALGWGAKFRVVTEPWRRRGARTSSSGSAPLGSTLEPRSEETVDEFFRRRFGTEVAEQVVQPFVSGVYAGLATELEMATTFPRILEFEELDGSVLRGALRRKRAAKKSRSSSAPSGGSPLRGTLGFQPSMSLPLERVAEGLQDRLCYGTRAVSIERSEAGGWSVRAERGEAAVCCDVPNVVLATPAPAAADLVTSLDPEWATPLRDIPYAPVATLQIGFERSQCSHAMDGFGFLAPPSAGLDLLGMIWSSTVFPWRCPEGRALITVFAGGRGRPELVEEPAPALESRLLKAAEQALGCALTPDLVALRCLKRAIPQYTVGHGQRLRQIKDHVARHSGLLLAGNYLEGVSWEAATQSGERAAAAILEQSS